MQVRLFFSALTGQIVLPNEEKMNRNIRIKKDDLFKRYVQSRRHTIQVTLKINKL